MSTGESKSTCPLCAGWLDPVEVRNALSRYTDRYICSACGNVEALTLARLNDNPNARTCLYFDEVMGVGLVNEEQPGYLPVWRKPPRAEHEWVRHYVDVVNTRVGLSRDDAMTIVGRSMSLGGV